MFSSTLRQGGRPELELFSCLASLFLKLASLLEWPLSSTLVVSSGILNSFLIWEIQLWFVLFHSLQLPTHFYQQKGLKPITARLSSLVERSLRWNLARQFRLTFLLKYPFCQWEFNYLYYIERGRIHATPLLFPIFDLHLSFPFFFFLKYA